MIENHKIKYLCIIKKILHIMNIERYIKYYILCI